MTSDIFLISIEVLVEVAKVTNVTSVEYILPWKDHTTMNKVIKAIKEATDAIEIALALSTFLSRKLIQSDKLTGSLTIDFPFINY
jgi:hypothetical protein